MRVINFIKVANKNLYVYDLTFYELINLKNCKLPYKF